MPERSGLISDEELVCRIKAGDMTAFDTLYRRYSSSLYRFAFSIIKSGEDSENVVQDAFLTFYENINKIEKTASVQYYIFSIAHNLTISLFRKKSRESEFVEYLRSIQLNESENLYSEDEYRELVIKANAIIDKLPDRQKEVYLLHKVEKLKYKEIAARLNISVNTVENHISRALKAILENKEE
jgi:RNA polymerase sigma-70 factor, ECF subfamily